MTDASQDIEAPPADKTGRWAPPEWLVVVGVAAVAVLVYTIPFWLHAYFYYVGDNPESFIPLWHHFGDQLRAGQWPTMDPAGWYGGNYAGEAVYTLWNPITLANYVVVSLFDDLAAGAAFVMIEFLTLLAVAVYALAREYGARRAPSAVLAIALPVCGFTLYYESAGWPIGLMAFTWVAFFWWATRRFARGHLMPLVPFLFGALAMTTGSPYATLGMIVVLGAVGIELLIGRQFKRLAQVAVMAACVGATAALVFLPLLGAMSVSSRQELAAIANNAFMVPDLGDLAGSSAPTYLPSILNWNGAVLENLPSTYFVWFAIPLLPWLRWNTLRRPSRPLVSIAVVTGIYAMLTFGPSNLWLFRWPIRVIEYFYLGLAVLLAVLLSAGLARDRIRERTLATVLLVGLGGYLSFAVRPEYYRMHLAVGIGVLALVLGAVWAYRRRGWLAFVGILLVGTVGVVTYQTSRLPVVGAGGPGTQPPRSVARLEQGHETYRGTVLQLATQATVRTQDQDDGEVLFGNLNAVAGHEAVNRYSGIGFAKFTSALCLDYKGATSCPDAFDRLWRSVPGTDVPLIDALRVETLVLQNALLRDEVDRTPPPGWRVDLRDEVRTVWVRTEPPRYPGRVSVVSPGTEVRSANALPEHEGVTFRAPDGGGKLMFARLDWPGYSATIDGRPVEVHNGEAGLITVDVPAGEHVLELDYVTPGLRIGVFALIAATVIVLAQSAMWWMGSRRRRRKAPALADAPGSDDTMEPELIHAGATGEES